MKSNKILLSLCFAAITLQTNAVMIHRNYIEQQVRDAARNYMTSLGFAPSNIPQKLMSEYEARISDAVAALNRIADYDGRSYVDDGEIERMVPREIESFAQTMRSLVFSYHLDQKVTTAIHDLLKKNNLSSDRIPSSMVSEYNRKGQEIMQKLRRTMRNDNRDYIRANEIESAVHNEMSAFIDRVKGSINQASNQGSSWSWWDWFTGNNSSNNNAANTSSYNNGPTIKNYELDNKVLETVYKVLREYGIDPDKVPARVVSDYSDKVQKVIKRMKQIMSNNYRNYVYVSEVEKAAREELKSVIDKIHYVGETCSVCLDNYVKGQKVGLLNCGHTFHKDCVAAWLVDNKTCPLCRAKNAIVAQHEVVP